MNRIHLARQLCIGLHGCLNQKRKYTGESYYNHPIRVCKSLYKWSYERDHNFTEYKIENMCVGALLHDVKEDVFPKIISRSCEDVVKNLFCEEIDFILTELTNQFTKSRYPDLNRLERKKRESERLLRVSDEAAVIKLFDIMDNLQDLEEQDPGFYKIYRKEKLEFVEKLFESRGYLPVSLYKEVNKVL